MQLTLRQVHEFEQRAAAFEQQLPASVSDTLRVVRWNKRRPKRVSSCAMALLTLAGETPCAAAVAEKLPRRATSRKI